MCRHRWDIFRETKAQKQLCEADARVLGCPQGWELCHGEFVTIIVELTKGVFLSASDWERTDREVRGRYCDGEGMNHENAADTKRDMNSVSKGSEWVGAPLSWRRGGGQTWEKRNWLCNAAALEGHDHRAAPAEEETGTVSASVSARARVVDATRSPPTTLSVGAAW